MDFAPYLKGDAKVPTGPRYDFTALKILVKQKSQVFKRKYNKKFGKYWSGKLGYTYLHAINKSDPSMPRQLLDKPMHKVDIGITYDNPKSGWNGSILG